MADIFVSKARLATFWQGIKSKLADKSDVGHKHSAADLTSGILAVERGGTGYASVDTTPTNGSAKMVTSGGIYTALASKANKIKQVTATFDGLAWDSVGDGSYQQALTFEGVTADSLILVKPADSFESAWVQMGCKATAQAANSVTFVCNDPQDVAVTVEVIILN